MRITVPILVQEQPAADGRPTMFTVRPLFHNEPLQRSDKLKRALNKLGGELYQFLYELGREPRHEDLAQWTFNPLLEETTLPLRLELDSGSYLRPFFLVGYHALDRKVFFSPSVQELHFEVLPGQTVEERATAVLTRHFRELEKEGHAVDVDQWALQGKARLTTLEVSLNPAALAKKPAPPKRAFLFGGEEKMDGHEELRKTGRALHQLYPDDLDRALGRDTEVEELGRLLASADRRPILLMGPRKVGKTTIVHELVFRMRSRPKERLGGNRELWLVSPLRLISGMSYLGQWENRVLAILKHAAKTDRVLYFDDLLGLFTAGRTIASDLNVAQVLKPAMEKRSVRVLAEITPEAWRLLRERDRSFADLFHVIPVNEPPEGETQRVLIHLARTLEEQHGCAFELHALPAVLELHRRFARDAAFPGKAAGFLRRLAVRHTKRHIGRTDVLDEFRAHSGLQLAFLNDGTALSREVILTSLSAKVAGQEHALDALADILLILKARLNDPRRPLGTLLFLGPTGVGKTETARALAQYLFGSADRLLRFDMNEYVEGTSSNRLIGTMWEPEGLLSSAIRRQPFSVVLFDEIEKAAPEVFDVLLAVLDEGRLTDSLGRVADFTNSVIIMTSNLGVRESRSRLGFAERQQNRETDDAVFVGAAEKFFRPEFFNRIDRIIPFRALEPSHLEGIAKELLKRVFSRDGLRRHECFFSISSPAMTRLIELGHHPQLGARALKRVIESEVALPIASHLASLPPGTPLMACLKVDEGQFRLEFQDLRAAQRSAFWPEKIAGLRVSDHGRVLALAYAALDRLEIELEKEAPAGNVDLANIKPEHARYFACREQFKKVERYAQAVQRALEPRRRTHTAARMPKQAPRKLVIRQYISGNPQLERLRDAVSLDVELAQWDASASAELPDLALTGLCRELALLEAMRARPADERPLMIVWHAFTPAEARFAFQLAGLFHDFVGGLWGAKVAYVLSQPRHEELLLNKIFGEPVPSTQALFMEGFNLFRLIPTASNVVFARQATGALSVFLMQVQPVASLLEAERRARDFMAGAKEFGIEQSGPIGSPALMITENKSITDFRSGLAIPFDPSAEEFRALMLSALPEPIKV